MLRVENVEVYGFEHANRGMRHPLQSHDKSDSEMENGHFIYGENDLNLAKKLVKAGSEHRKFLRQISIWMDVTAPMFFYLQLDTYKIGTTSNSESKMHRLMARPFKMTDFSIDEMSGFAMTTLDTIVRILNAIRKLYQEEQDAEKKKVWWNDILRLLPESYVQKRTFSMNYETALNMICQRRNHKLPEWQQFCDVLTGLPYMSDFLDALKEKGEGVENV